MTVERKTAFITGAGKGIGYGIAKTLAEEGYDLILHSRSSVQGTEKLADLARSKGLKAHLVRGDLSNVQEVEQIFRRISDLTRGLNLVVSNSGLTVCKPFFQITPQDLDQVTGLDWRGSFFVTQYAAKLMVEQKTEGHILLITSNQAHMVYPDGSMYGSVKAALSHFTKCAAVELAKHGIRVNAISPGYTDTGDPRMGEKESTYSAIPMRRWCTPKEIGKAVVFLDSVWSKSITGTELLIDGGGCLTCKDNREHTG